MVCCLLYYCAFFNTETETLRNEYERKLRALSEENELLNENNNRLSQMEENYLIMEGEFCKLKQDWELLNQEKVNLFQANKNYDNLLQQVRKLFPEFNDNEFEILSNLDQLNSKIFESIQKRDEQTKQVNTLTDKNKELQLQIDSQLKEIEQLKEEKINIIEKYEKSKLNYLQQQATNATTPKTKTQIKTEKSKNKTKSKSSVKSKTKIKKMNSGNSKAQGIDLTSDDDNENEEEQEEEDNDIDDEDEDMVNSKFKMANDNLLRYNKKLEKRVKKLQEQIKLKKKEIEKKDNKIEQLEFDFAKLDDKMGKGDYDPQEEQILHLRMNPLETESSRFRKEQTRTLNALKKENETLKSKIESYKQAFSNVNSSTLSGINSNNNSNNNSNLVTISNNSNNDNNNDGGGDDIGMNMNEEKEREVDVMTVNQNDDNDTGNNGNNGNNESRKNENNTSIEMANKLLILELANKEHLEEIGMLKKNVETSSLESINLRKRIENLEKIKSRMKTLFTDISAQFRENICSLFGYNVSVSKDRKTYTLKHTWMGSSSDAIVLQLDKGGTFVVCETPFIKQHKDLMKKLQQTRSLPIFFAEMTMRLFSEETVMTSH